MEGVHNFFDPSFPVPPVKVKKIDVGCSELLKRGFDGYMQRFRVVADVQNLLFNGLIASLEIGSVLERKIERLY